MEMYVRPDLIRFTQDALEARMNLLASRGDGGERQYQPFKRDNFSTHANIVVP